MLKKSSLFLILSLLLISSAFGQEYFLPTDELSRVRIERAGLQTQASGHMGMLPALASDFSIDVVEGLGEDSTKYYYWVTSKIFGEHLIEFEKEDFALYADFLFNFGYGQEVDSPEEEKDLFTNTRGFLIGGRIGQKVYFQTDFRENQARFPNYLDNFVDSLGVVPGMGRIKEFKEDGYDFNIASGYVGIQAANWLNIQFGHYKQFYGHGSRSILLSDNSFNIPQASYQISSKGGKFTYRYSLGILQNLERLPAGDAPESLFKRKNQSVLYLSYKPIPKLEIGLFESTIWKAYDDSTGTEPFNFSSLNPIPLVYPSVKGLQSSKSNSVVGLNLAWHPLERLSLYGQFMIDDLDEEAYAYQVGIKTRKVFERLDFLVEYNTVKAGTYAHPDPLLSYTHYNQPLAHILGAGFSEMKTTAQYYYKRWLFQVNLVYADFEEYGRDPLVSELAQEQSSSENLFYTDYRVAYVFNPKTNMQIYAGFTDRDEQRRDANISNQFWYFGIRTSLMNSYTDF